MYKRLLPRILPCLFIAALAGCANMQAEKQPAAMPAQQAMQAGHYTQAAHLYLQLAGNAQSSRQQHYLVLAATAAQKAGDNKLAQHALARIFPSLLTPEDRSRTNLVQARLYLARNEPAAALKRLQPPPHNLPANLADQILKLRGEILFKLGRALPAVEALVRRGQQLSGNRASANNTMIWQGLQSSSLPDENATALSRAGVTVRGWIALARIERQSWANRKALQQALEQWRHRFPNHPASASIASQLVARYQKRHQYPQRIALLLPLSGRLQPAGQAVRDGFLAGRFMSAGNSLPTIAIYDTGSKPQTAVQAYQKAVKGGAQVVVGPLTKSAVSAVAGMAKPSVPQLALNYLGHNDQQQSPSDFYRMGLSPDDDARQVAGLASQAGLHRALTMAPNNQWGRNVVKSFRKSLQKEGGVVVDSVYYPPGASDFSDAIKKLLGLNAAKARYEALEHTLRRKLQFQPEPQDDAGFIFLAAQPREARLIRPQLKFYRASNIPVYATSSVYPGTPNPGANRDEDGITFCDTPWTLSEKPRITKPRSRIKQLWPQAFASYPRLFALGLDAYRLIPLVNARALAPGTHFQGYTGSLYNNGQGRILRGLKCGRFKNGKVVAIGNSGNTGSQ